MAVACRVELALAGESGPVIHPNIFGHFAEHLGRCIYEGVWVGEGSPIPNVRGIRKDVVLALRRLKVPVLRWPGGCFADEYHWRDGIGPRDERPRMINTHWGGVVETNHFGTHEFMDLCEQIGAEPYVCGNVGSGTVREMMEWVEYMTSDAESPMANLRRKNGRDEPWRLRYFGVGNENWACGGNMRAEYYADEYRRYATYVKSYAGNVIERIACGPAGADYAWTETLMKSAVKQMQGLSLHNYTLPTGDWGKKGSSTEFTEDEWHSTFARTLQMEELVTRHSAIMDRYDPERRVGLVVDEWGTWFDAEPGTNPAFLYQRSTLRDALVAATNLGIFCRHAERVTMANLAQTINVLQAVVLTDGGALRLTPTYHAFEMCAAHQGATLVPLHFESPEYGCGSESISALHGFASRGFDGTLHVTLVHLDPRRSLGVAVGPLDGEVTARVLTANAMNAENTLDAPSSVIPAPFRSFTRRGTSLELDLPPKSLVTLSCK
ncbi:MAG TPA: alpha-N-arabinofuranosidase [Polyangiaceae bacterium]